MSRTTIPLLPTLTLLTFSLPLIILATITTTLACSALALRVSLVYLEMGIALLQSAFSAPAPSGKNRVAVKARVNKINDARQGSQRTLRGTGGPRSAGSVERKGTL